MKITIPPTEIEEELIRRRNNYFDARREYNEKRRLENYNKDDLLNLAEHYGYTKGLYSDFKDQHPNVKLLKDL